MGIASKKKKQNAGWETLVPKAYIEEIHRRLVAGETSYALAKEAQTATPPVFADTKLQNVAVWFNTYRKKHVVPEQNKALLKAAKHSGAVVVRKRFDVLADLEDLAAINQERLKVGLTAEKEYSSQLGIHLPLEEVTKLALAYGKSLTDLAELYLEIGVIHRVPKKLTATVTDLMGGRKIFEWTPEQEARFNKSNILLEGVAVVEGAVDEQGI